MRSRSILLAVVAWFVAAFILSLAMPPPQASTAFRAALVAGPLLGLTLAYGVWPAFRAAIDALPLRLLVGLHVIRAVVGAAFLVLGQHGLLPGEFATQAGVGDIVAGVGALLLVAVPNWNSKGFALLLGAWAIYGMADFINVQRVIMVLAAQGRQGEFVAMSGPPLALVPYFGVPLLWFVHIRVLVHAYATVFSASTAPQGLARNH